MSTPQSKPEPRKKRENRYKNAPPSVLSVRLLFWASEMMARALSPKSLHKEEEDEVKKGVARK